MPRIFAPVPSQLNGIKRSRRRVLTPILEYRLWIWLSAVLGEISSSPAASFAVWPAGRYQSQNLDLTRRQASHALGYCPT
jgi:hypothetical protein